MLLHCLYTRYRDFHLLKCTSGKHDKNMGGFTGGKPLTISLTPLIKFSAPPKFRFTPPILSCVKSLTLTPLKSSLSGAACTPLEIFPPLLIMKIRPWTKIYGKFMARIKVDVPLFSCSLRAFWVYRSIKIVSFASYHELNLLPCLLPAVAIIGTCQIFPTIIK